MAGPFGRMEPAKPARAIGAPKDVITLAKRVMGGIDLDPYTTERLALHEGATAFYHRKAHRRPWRAPGTKKRAFLASGSTSITETRELFHRLLRAWDSGDILEAFAWTQCNEALCRLPWLWDKPLSIVIPFRRLPGQSWDKERDAIRTHACSAWSFVVYFPPASQLEATERFKALNAEVSQLSLGRVIRPPGHPLDAHWEDAWVRRYKDPFDYEPEEIDVDG